MDPLASLALVVVLAAVFFFALYRVIRVAVRDGIRDSRVSSERDPNQV